MTPAQRSVAVLEEARRQLEEEHFRNAVELEKYRLRTHKTYWQRFVACLPFTVTITRKTK